MKIFDRHIKLSNSRKQTLTGMVLLGLIMASCVEEYWPDLGTKYDEVLVVEGSITNLPGPYTVKLSLSTRLENPEYIPLRGYAITIMDNAGNSELLTDNHDGSYQTARDGITGIPGRYYKIDITSPDGQTYVSAFEKMENPVGIDTMWAAYETQENLAYDHDLEGYRFYISTKRAAHDSTYFFWKLRGTYKYHANHFIKYVFDGELRPFSHYDSLYTCWKTYSVPEIFTHHTLNVSEPLLQGYPLQYVNTEDKKLSIRYSLFAEQYIISKETHEYWKNLREQNSNLGSLYAVQPFQIKGNISNINDPEELVLGYFMTASVTDYRIFVNRPWYAKFYYLIKCYLNSEDFTHQLWLMINHWPVYLAAVYGEYGQGPALPSTQQCVNCTENGGTIVQPDFWIENDNQQNEK